MAKIGRRSFLQQVVGGGLLAGSVALVAGSAEAQRRRHVAPRRMAVDADDHDRARPMLGEAPVSSKGCTDGDAGRGADAPGHGRCRGRSRGVTCNDYDSGAAADPVGRGRRCEADMPNVGAGARERWVVCPGHRRCP